jgi:hypothetical protein
LYRTVSEIHINKTRYKSTIGGNRRDTCRLEDTQQHSFQAFAPRVMDPFDTYQIVFIIVCGILLSPIVLVVAVTFSEVLAHRFSARRLLIAAIPVSVFLLTWRFGV